jgi:hypothetical protein
MDSRQEQLLAKTSLTVVGEALAKLQRRRPEEINTSIHVFNSIEAIAKKLGILPQNP